MFELHLELIEPIGIDKEDCVEDDVASDAEEDKGFPGVSVGERTSEEGHNNCWHTLNGSVKGLDSKEGLLKVVAVGHTLPPLKALLKGLHCGNTTISPVIPQYHLYSCHFFLNLNLDCRVICQVVTDSRGVVQIHFASLL